MCTSRLLDMTCIFVSISGLFSDTHVLALMYAGELCWWFLDSMTEDDRVKYTNFHAKDIAIDCLQTYIKASEGPLKGKGWNCDKAKDLISQLTDR